MTTVAAAKDDSLRHLFPVDKPVIGTIHLAPLPGSPQYTGDQFSEILMRALSDAKGYVDGGVDGLIVENSGDLPFLKPQDIGPETVAFMTEVTSAVVRSCAVAVGVNCLANAVVPAISVAAASSAAFVRANQWVNAYVANEGYVEGAAASATRFRRSVSATHVRVLADVHVKHGSHAIVADRSVEEQARDAEFFDADVLVATGSRTGEATSTDEVKRVGALTSLPVIVGSGLTASNVTALFSVADGAIVGSSLKVDGSWWNLVDQRRVEDLMQRVSKLRGESSRYS